MLYYLGMPNQLGVKLLYLGQAFKFGVHIVVKNTNTKQSLEKQYSIAYYYYTVPSHFHGKTKDNLDCSDWGFKSLF